MDMEKIIANLFDYQKFERNEHLERVIGSEFGFSVVKDQDLELVNAASGIPNSGVIPAMLQADNEKKQLTPNKLFGQQGTK